MYMSNYDVLKDKEVIVMSAVLAVAKSTESELNKNQIIGHRFLHKHANDTPCNRASHTVELPGSMFNQYSNGFIIPTSSIDV